MPVVKTTSPVAWPSAPHGVAVEARAVLEQHVAGLAASHDQLLDGLELGRARRARSSSNSAASTVVDAPRRRAPSAAARARGRARGASRRRRRRRAPRRPRSSRSCDGLRDAHVRLDPADERLVAAAEVEAVGARGARRRSSRSRGSSRCTADLGRRCGPGPCGYCSVTSDRHARGSRAPCDERRAALRRRASKVVVRAGSPPGRRSTTSAARSRSSRRAQALALTALSARSR